MATHITEYIANTETAGPPEPRPPAGHPSGRLWRGFTLGDGYDYRFPAGGSLDYELSHEPYRLVYVYRDAHALITYCEGDLILEVYPDAEAFDAALESARAFYRDHD